MGTTSKGFRSNNVLSPNSSVGFIALDLFKICKFWEIKTNVGEDVIKVQNRGNSKQLNKNIVLKAFKQHVIVMICDPKLMRKFVKTAKTVGLSYEVPMDLRVKPKYVNHFVIVDEECMKYTHVQKVIEELKANVVVVNEDNITSQTLKILGINHVEVLTLGVDIGRRLAYAMFADDMLIDVGFVENPKELMSKLDEVVNDLKPSKTVVKVGVTEGRGTELISDLFKFVASKNLQIILVDEANTSKETTSYYVKAYGVRDKDLRAAINIALKDGIKTFTY